MSYADTAQGHHGGIYQAGGWTYAGATRARLAYAAGDRRYHGRALRSTRTTHPRPMPGRPLLEWARAHIAPDLREVRDSAKHRYLMPLDDAMRERIAPLARAYPKRPICVGSADSGTAGTTRRGRCDSDPDAPITAP